MEEQKRTNRPDNKLMWRYAGMVMQFFVSIGIAVFIGLKADGWMQTRMPVWAWLLPLLVITGIIIKVFRDTGRKN